MNKVIAVLFLLVSSSLYAGSSRNYNHKNNTMNSEFDNIYYQINNGKSADSDKVDGLDSTAFVTTSTWQTINSSKTWSNYQRFDYKIIASSHVEVASTNKIFLDGGGDTYFSNPSDNAYDFYSGGSSILSMTVNDNFNIKTQNLLIPATKKFYLDGGGDTYIHEIAANNIDFTCGGSRRMTILGNGWDRVAIFGMCAPDNSGNADLGDGTYYWGDVYYQTLHKVGGWGYFDTVEMQDGTMLSPVNAIKAMKVDTRGKKTPYGLPIIDHRTLPKLTYYKAKIKTEVKDTNGKNKVIEKEAPRDNLGYPIGAEDSEDVNATISIILSAIRELSGNIELLQQENTELKNRLADLESRISKLESK